MPMKCTIRLYRSPQMRLQGILYSGFTEPGHHFLHICPSKLHEYFDFPQEQQEIYLNISNKELPQGYRCYVPYKYSDIKIQTPSNQRFREMLAVDADEALISLGLIGKPFYINLQYEEES